ncbi:alpha/beta fold hydrolase [Streptomyces prasinopilosus]|uniref:Pimeloyl-ACP methyl ester carboxylesterase n=1 Tax=Streptomyces prasinopilosus TaxID=67344 RepID=A0A1G6ZX71_9ACTN|nr:alpha/beta hydrolase [Streptomyces prasinopilosus]SDE07274.1 Pimeloyl-ACP methyl ester carboxylesterase [Streptomyces prasinopilosus]
MEHIRHAVRRALPLVVLLPAAALAAAGPSAASGSGGGAAPRGGAKPTVVLVHGAWADASGWHEVVRSLQAEGYPVVAPANPLRGLSADSDYLAARLKTLKGPLVLVGHSYGGAVITNAAVGNPDVASLVYVAGFAPDKGETALQLLAEHPGSHLTDDAEAPVPTALDAVPLGGGPTDVDLYIKPEKFGDVFLSNRLDAARTNALAASQRPAHAATSAQPSEGAAWRTIPSWSLVATDDRTIGTENLRSMAKRAGSTTVEVDAPHAVLETDPDAVTDLILRAARGARPGLAEAGAGEGAAVLGGAAVLAVAGGTALVVRSRRS